MLRQLSNITSRLTLKVPSFVNGASIRRFTDSAPKSIFVGNLPWEASESDITEFFSKYGNVTSIKLMKDNQTGRPRGFGFITLNGDVDKAVSELDGKELKGRSLRVNEARPPTPRDPNNSRPRQDFRDRGDDRGGRGDRGVSRDRREDS